MKITNKIVADKIAGYLRHEISLVELVDWAENAVMDGVLAPGQAGKLAAVLGRLGAADVRAFGLAWEDCEGLLRQLGYAAKVDIVAA